MNNLISLYLFFIGLAVGSFLNVLIDRLPKEEKITGRSHCDYCKKKLSGWDLIPVISFIVLRGKCRYCKHRLSYYYPLVEIITGIFYVLIFNFQSIWWLGIISCLIVIFFSDLKYQIIPDSIQIALFIFILISNLQFPISKQISIFQQPIFNYLLNGLVVMLPILFLWAVTKGKGMGFGDVKLAFNIGFLLGIKSGLLSLYFAFIVGAVVGLFLIFMKKSKLKSKIAFGPFLTIGTIVMIFYQKEILAIIGKIYGF